MFWLPPSGLSPSATASPSINVDLPDPFSPTRNTTSWARSSGASRTPRTAGSSHGYPPSGGTRSPGRTTDRRNRSRARGATAACRPSLRRRADQVRVRRRLLDDPVLRGELRLELDALAVELGVERREAELRRRRRGRLREGRDDLPHLLRVRLRVVERLVHRAREAVDDVTVLLDVLRGRDVDAVGEARQGLRRRRVELPAEERLGEQRGVDAMGVQRGRHLGEGDLEPAGYAARAEDAGPALWPPARASAGPASSPDTATPGSTGPARCAGCGSVRRCGRRGSPRPATRARGGR